ncbi:cobalt/nickel transport system ATP-binding protein/zinc transport system ATP-binding protein/biotin transport system ATP-binding protein/energy-coupling factor transport system ATP-binding protein [Alkalispirochaeta americana]|uniref:Cobalt/nickel transport system ATP-binding protein/zinc transport system ATP-binding protein/biotin transport system ATP-binding protein/energy-coupling factor transport system ATP-binding protein n=1 Tax=Alkalispirochaeta americana TaxID=159291 RepID=A0A1N6NZS9_9SPIO|nr:ABC transporter ATP-binding protein [Alkalispirochaeta americana]SIP97536.1 cobalt/nickel transport system ATP-binding protein/zinc transport system ATP-binding protein/biotin transport system ATP-binding protein/energy-coupling factor transport system ATP-binding protein [Alkalispirochaeta americana]
MALLVLEGVSVSLGEPPREILRDIDLTIPSGTITLLLGTNGCGKSVLFRTMLGLTGGYRGEIRLKGTPLGRDASPLHRLAGVVFQNPDQQLFGATLREDLLIGLPRDTPLDQEILSSLGLSDLLERAPAELSGGQRRRLAIAGALMGQPELLFLDEPFIELDYPSIQNLLERLDTLRQGGSSVILASHECQDIWPLVDQLIVIAEGRLLYQGPPSGGAHLITPDQGLRPLPSEGVLS